MDDGHLIQVPYWIYRKLVEDSEQDLEDFEAHAAESDPDPVIDQAHREAIADWRSFLDQARRYLP